MAEMGDGYGSECHLLRYLGRHRNELDRAIISVTGATGVAWRDFRFDRDRRWPDAEWTGLDFLPENAATRNTWRRWWPQSGTPPSWDAIGVVSIAGIDEWLLVEAKAHRQELVSSCQARDVKSRALIQSSLEETKRALGAAPHCDWLQGYYQYCNRLGVLYFLLKQGVAARLLFIYFTGDGRTDGRECPSDEDGWTATLVAQDDHVGLPDVHELSGRIHKLFLPVCG